MDSAYGRIEQRRASVSDDVAWLQQRHAWPGLKVIGQITAKREIGPSHHRATAFFTSCRAPWSVPMLQRGRARALGYRERAALGLLGRGHGTRTRPEPQDAMLRRTWARPAPPRPRPAPSSTLEAPPLWELQPAGWDDAFLSQTPRPEPSRPSAIALGTTLSDLVSDLALGDLLFGVLSAEQKTSPPAWSKAPPQGETRAMPDRVNGAGASATPTHFFISYRRRAERDAALAAFLRERLIAAGHEVFIDVDMPLGTRWSEEITSRSAGATFSSSSSPPRRSIPDGAGRGPPGAPSAGAPMAAR